MEYKKIKINLPIDLMNEVNKKSELSLNLVIRKLLEEYSRNKNLRSKIEKNLWI